MSVCVCVFYGHLPHLLKIFLCAQMCIVIAVDAANEFNALYKYYYLHRKEEFIVSLRLNIGLLWTHMIRKVGTSYNTAALDTNCRLGNVLRRSNGFAFTEMIYMFWAKSGSG